MLGRIRALRGVVGVGVGVGIGFTFERKTSLGEKYGVLRVPVLYSPRVVFAEQVEPPVVNDKGDSQEKSKELSEDEKWALKGEQCPLCKMALSSPCINEFKVFDTCLEKLKEKYGDEKPPDEEGMECFSGFHACMMANLDFFKNYVEEREAEEAAARENEASTNEENKLSIDNDEQEQVSVKE